MLKSSLQKINFIYICINSVASENKSNIRDILIEQMENDRQAQYKSKTRAKIENEFNVARGGEKIKKITDIYPKINLLQNRKFLA